MTEDMLENETPQEYYARHVPGLAEHIAKCICKWFDVPFVSEEETLYLKADPL